VADVRDVQSNSHCFFSHLVPVHFIYDVFQHLGSAVKERARELSESGN